MMHLTRIKGRRLAYTFLLAALALSACDSREPADDDKNVKQDPGTFSAAVEGTHAADLIGEARYGLNEDGDLRIVFIDDVGRAREVIVFARSGRDVPGEGRLRISEAPDEGIASGADTFFGFYMDESEEGLRSSDSGSITIIDREDGLLEGQFHFTAAFSDGSGYLSILGAFAAEETDDLDGVGD